MKKHGKKSRQACAAAHEAYDTTRQLHQAQLETELGIEFIFPLPLNGPIR